MCVHTLGSNASCKPLFSSVWKNNNFSLSVLASHSHLGRETGKAKPGWIREGCRCWLILAQGLGRKLSLCCCFYHFFFFSDKRIFVHLPSTSHFYLMVILFQETQITVLSRKHSNISMQLVTPPLLFCFDFCVWSYQLRTCDKIIIASDVLAYTHTLIVKLQCSSIIKISLFLLLKSIFLWHTWLQKNSRYGIRYQGTTQKTFCVVRSWLSFVVKEIIIERQLLTSLENCQGLMKECGKCVCGNGTRDCQVNPGCTFLYVFHSSIYKTTFRCHQMRISDF